MAVVTGQAILQAERDNSALNPQELAELIYKLPYGYSELQEIREIIRNDPAFNKSELLNLDRPARFARASKMAKRLVELQKIHSKFSEEVFLFNAMREIDEDLPLDLHVTMFTPSIENLGSDEQKAKWLPLCKSYKILGTYAQTEIAHGSNLSGLETTAVFDKATDTFILNSNTSTGMKWWPGDLGKSSNMALVMAQLYIDGVNYFIQPFLVQLRDFKTHKPLPGITVFEIGPKQGYNANDNGALQLSNVRIPRENMLSRFAQVSRSGEFTIVPGADKIAYSTMLRIRVLILLRSADVMSRAVTIATRYSTIRRQFKDEKLSDEAESEVPILNYPIHKWRIIPYIAASYVGVANSHILFRGLQDLENRVKKEDFSTLKEIHVTASCMKCFFSWIALEGIEACRRSCGGNGYLFSAGFADLYNRSLPLITYEGENYVLFQQGSRFLIKLRKRFFSLIKIIGNAGNIYTDDLSIHPSLVKKVPKFCDFLLKPVKSFVWADKPEYFSSLEVHVSMWQSIAKFAFLSHPKVNSFNEDSIRWFDVTIIYSCYLTMKNFQLWMKENFSSTAYDDETFVILKNKLGVLFSLWLLFERPKISTMMLSANILSIEQLKLLEAFYLNLLDEIRNDAVALVDGFDHSDYLLHSSLGRHDGTVYETLLKDAHSSTLNRMGDVLSPFTEFLSKL